jgi:hypothetical protein
MRTITTATFERGQILAVCDDGTIWLGLVRSSSEADDLIVEWKPLNSPPDGDPFADKRSIWDKIEDDLRDNKT